MTDEEFAELIKLEHELYGLEFKPPGQLGDDRRLFFQVARASMGMANRRDGGRIVIGVREDAGKFEPIGLTPTEVKSWRYELLADALAPLVDPAVVFDVEVRSYDGRAFVLVVVEEFVDVPVVCRRNAPRNLKPGEKATLRDGAVYVRPRRKPETTEIAGQTEMRELVELATEKRLRQVLATVSRAGGTIQSGSPANVAFEAELGEEFK